MVADVAAGRRDRRILGDPLVSSAWPLVLNTGINGLLGVAYWMVAARLFDGHAVATNAALLAAMSTISGITQLNLGQSLAVLVPRSGLRARRVIAQAYGAVTLVSLVVLALFLWLVLPHLDQLSEVLDSPVRVAAFVVGVLALNVFAMQDTALVGLRLGRIVPVENGVFGATKLALLVPLAVALPAFGIYVSWVIPMAVLVPVISLVIFRRRSRRSADPGEPVEKWSRVNTRSLVGLDYVGYLFQVSSTLMLPVVALELLGPAAAAVFAIAWQTSTQLDLLATNVGTALTVESSYGRSREQLRRTVLRYGVLLVAVVSLLGITFAPLILSLYGPQYADDGVTTLRLLLLASLARALCTFAVAEARAHRETWFIVWFRALNAVLVLGLAAVLAPRIGVEGVAVGWLVAQLVCGMLAFARMRPGARGVRR